MIEPRVSLEVFADLFFENIERDSVAKEYPPLFGMLVLSFSTLSTLTTIVAVCLDSPVTAFIKGSFTILAISALGVPEEPPCRVISASPSNAL